MDDKKPLSQFGIGPVYAATVFLLTLTALFLDHVGLLFSLRVPAACLPLKLLGAVLILAAALLWCNAVIATKIAQHIRRNELVTTGAYAWVRNPIYSAIMLAMWGLLLWCGNLLLLILCPVYYILMTVMVKATEEKWLADLYGKPYLDYCNRVNRCLPWFPRQSGGC